MKCVHKDFDAEVNVIRLSDSGRFNAEIKIRCKVCNCSMRFLGLPMGLDLNGASVSPDGKEARLAIHPVGQPIPNFDEHKQPAGFRIFNGNKELKRAIDALTAIKKHHVIKNQLISRPLSKSQTIHLCNEGLGITE